MRNYKDERYYILKMCRVFCCHLCVIIIIKLPYQRPVSSDQVIAIQKYHFYEIKKREDITM